MTNKDWEDYIQNIDTDVHINRNILIRPNTSNLLIKLGFPNLPFYMGYRHIISALSETGTDGDINYHNLGKENLKDLPNMLERPIAVMHSISEVKKPNRFVLLTDKKDLDGNPIIIAVNINSIVREQDYIPHKVANIVLSCYGKNNFEWWLNKNVDKNSFIFANEMKIKELFKTKVQFPCEVTTLSNNILRDLGENVNCKPQILKDYDLNQIRKADIVVSTLNKALEENKEEYADYYDNNKNIISEIGFGYRKEDPSTIYHIVGDNLVENYSSVNNIFNRIQKEGINKLILREYLDYDEKESDISKIELAARLVKFNKDYDYYNFVDYAETGETINETIDRFIIETKVQMDKDHGESIKESLKNIIIDEEENKELPENNYFYLEAIQLIKNINTIYPEKTEVNQNEGKGGK